MAKITNGNKTGLLNDVGIFYYSRYFTTQNHGELSDLWEIGKKLWKHEFSAIYELTRKCHWPDYLVTLVSALVGKPIFFYFTVLTSQAMTLHRGWGGVSILHHKLL